MLNGYDLGTIGKKLVEQACQWPGWDDLPIVFPPDRAGSHTRTYPAIERKNLDSALSDLSGVANGPDFRFQLERIGSDFYQWRFDLGPRRNLGSSRPTCSRGSRTRVRCQSFRSIPNGLAVLVRGWTSIRHRAGAIALQPDARRQRLPAARARV